MSRKVSVFLLAMLALSALVIILSSIGFDCLAHRLRRPGSRLRPESLSRPIRVTIPCAKSHRMSRRLTGHFILRA